MGELFIKAVEETRKLIKSIVFDEKQKELIRKIKNARQRLAEIFNYQEIVMRCRKCHKDGVGCCQTSGIITPQWRDVIYILANNPNFELPELGQSICSFLSKDGCLLKENRPIRCLEFNCKDMSSILEKLSLKKQFRENLQILNQASFALIQSIVEEKDIALRAAYSSIIDLYLVNYLSCDRKKSLLQRKTG